MTNSKTNRDIDVSIVIPLYNELESIQPLYQTLKEVLDNINKVYEIIFIDDGSSDDSFNILEDLYKNGENIKVIQFRKNHGKSAALSIGFQEAKGDIIITMDADLQDDPKEIPRFIEKLNEGYDLVSGWKFKRKDPLSKTIPSRIFNMVTSLLSGVKIHDFNCGFKAYKRKVTQDIKVYGELHRYLPVLAHWQGYKIGEIKVEHHSRKYGKSKFGAGRFFKGFFDIQTVLFLTKFNKRPLHLFGMFGLTFSATGVMIDLYLVLRRILFGEAFAPRLPLLILGVLLILLGIQFISIGLIGEMISNLQQEKDQYSITKKLL